MVFVIDINRELIIKYACSSLRGIASPLISALRQGGLNVPSDMHLLGTVYVQLPRTGTPGPGGEKLYLPK